LPNSLPNEAAAKQDEAKAGHAGGQAVFAADREGAASFQGKELWMAGIPPARHRAKSENGFDESVMRDLVTP
jgi:hypothetical protein